MRQAGLLAAAGLYALENNVERLTQDHQNVRFLCDEMVKIEGFSVEIRPQTNIVYFDIDPRVVDSIKLVKGLMKVGINVNGSYSSKSLRMVTHLDVNREDIERVVFEVKKLSTSGAIAPTAASAKL